MPLSDIMSSIFKGLFDPTALARELAQEGIHPEQLMQEAQKTQQLPSMPTAGGQNQQNTGSNAAEQQQGSGIGSILGDLMQPMPKTAQQGQLGSFLKDSFNQVGPDMNAAIGGVVNSLGQTPPTAQAGQAGEAIKNTLSSLMQPAVAPNQVVGAGPQAQQDQMPAMPPQLQGLPPQLLALLPNMAQGTPAGNQFPPGLPPNMATSSFPGRPEFPGSNGPVLPNGAPIPQSRSELGLAMQPNTQPMQPNRPGIERPASATTPNIGKDAQGVRQIALQTWYQGGVTNPFGLAALTSTGEHESGFSPGNLNRSWADPSESGKKGTSGGMFSWRNERLSNLQAYAKSKGESGNGSPQTQAEFFLHENPKLKDELNSAKSADEAQAIMNKNIAFAGYNREGGEAGRRMQTARTLVPQMEAFIKDPKTPVTPPQGTTAAADTIAPIGGGTGTTDPGAGPFSALDALAGSGDSSGAALDMNLPNPPPPVAPQPGRYDVNPQAMMAMMQMLGPMAGGVQMPSLMQLMAGK